MTFSGDAEIADIFNMGTVNRSNQKSFMKGKSKMIKNEYVFTIMVGEPKIGEGIVLKLSDGRIVRTSRVVDYFVWRNGDIVIYTQNSIYRMYKTAA